jgi:hypothetical protein
VSEVVDHGFIRSLYSFDPNIIAVEFSVPAPGVDLRAQPVMADSAPTPLPRLGAEPVPERGPSPPHPPGRKTAAPIPARGFCSWAATPPPRAGQAAAKAPGMCSASGALLLPYPPGCRVAAFVRREKRFTAVTVDPHTGAELRAHPHNTGSMLGLLRPGTQALLSPAPQRATGPQRALQWTLEALALPGGHRGESPAWVGVNTLSPNRLLAAAWRARLLPEALAYTGFAPEAKPAPAAWTPF